VSWFGPIVLLTSDPAALHRSWLVRYLPELVDDGASRFPAIDTMVSMAGPGFARSPFP